LFVRQGEKRKAGEQNESARRETTQNENEDEDDENDDGEPSCLSFRP
jgi:hypothetical protein